MDVLTNNTTINLIKFQKMSFLYNALENGWKVKKKGKSYVFTKNHEGKKEVLLDTYLKRFMMRNFDNNKFFKEL